MQRRKFFAALFAPALVPFIPTSLAYRLKSFQFRHDLTDDQMRGAGLTEQCLNEPLRPLAAQQQPVTISVSGTTGAWLHASGSTKAQIYAQLRRQGFSVPKEL